MTEKPKMRADSLFIQQIRIQAARHGMTVPKFTEELAKSEKINSLSLNSTYRDLMSGKNEKKYFNFKL